MHGDRGWVCEADAGRTTPMRLIYGRANLAPGVLRPHVPVPGMRRALAGCRTRLARRQVWMLRRATTGLLVVAGPDHARPSLLWQRAAAGVDGVAAGWLRTRTDDGHRLVAASP